MAAPTHAGHRPATTNRARVGRGAGPEASYVQLDLRGSCWLSMLELCSTVGGCTRGVPAKCSGPSQCCVAAVAVSSSTPYKVVC